MYEMEGLNNEYPNFPLILEYNEWSDLDATLKGQLIHYIPYSYHSYTG